MAGAIECPFKVGDKVDLIKAFKGARVFRDEIRYAASFDVVAIEPREHAPVEEWFVSVVVTGGDGLVANFKVRELVPLDPKKPAEAKKPEDSKSETVKMTEEYWVEAEKRKLKAQETLMGLVADELADKFMSLIDKMEIGLEFDGLDSGERAEIKKRWREIAVPILYDL